MSPASDTGRAAIRAEPYDYAAALRLTTELGLAEPIAITLVRRGHATPESARAFLDASERHAPSEMNGVAEAVAIVRATVEAGRRIVVHGDYDVDGTAATAILIAALRRLGADCEWRIPSRLGDGYGLSVEVVEEIADRGVGLLITADCGITSVEEVRRARELGLEVIVTDHHQPGPEGPPGCCVLHPELSGYPFDALCGAAVAHKLAGAIGEETGTGPAEPDLDLVALATVADMVPLRGENRSLVRRGLEEIRRASRPGLRALMAAASIELAAVDEGDLSFRLAPRINAAGRMHRADGCVELMLTGDRRRASEIAAELDAANRERREVERSVLHEAGGALRELPDELREAPAIVLAGLGWHAGVVGIVASRLAERHLKPVVLIALDEDGSGKGSGRSIPDFDLLAGLEACSEHLIRFGGHRAAAGLEIEGGEVEAFRAAFCAHAAAVIADSERRPVEQVDAVVGGEGLGYEVAEQILALGPFGKGNPPVRLLVPWAQIGDLQPMGEDGRHARFTLSSGAGRAAGVAFGVNGSLEATARAPHDLTVSLELNEWNGTSSPRVVLGRTWEQPGAGAAEGAGCPDPADDPEWWSRADRARRDSLEPGPVAAVPASAARRREIDRRGCSLIAQLVELVSSGGSVLALCADAERRRALLTGAADPGRFGAVAALGCRRCASTAAGNRIAAVRGSSAGLALADWGLLAASPELGSGFDHVVAVDPPAFPALLELARGGEGYLHLCWGAAELALAERVHDADWELRPKLAAAYRAIREASAAGGLGGSGLRAAFEGPGLRPSGPEAAGRTLRVLVELGLVQGDPTAGAEPLRAVSSMRTELERSGAYRAYSAWHEEGRRFLQSQSKAP